MIDAVLTIGLGLLFLFWSHGVYLVGLDHGRRRALLETRRLELERRVCRWCRRPPFDA